MSASTRPPQQPGWQGSPGVAKQISLLCFKSLVRLGGGEGLWGGGKKSQNVNYPAPGQNLGQEAGVIGGRIFEGGRGERHNVGVGGRRLDRGQLVPNTCRPVAEVD